MLSKRNLNAVANKFKMSNDLKRIVKSQIQPQFGGCELLIYLSDKFRYNSPDEWQEIISDKRIYVNGLVAKAGVILQENDLLEYHHLDHPEPEVDFDYTIVAETDGYLVLDKPGNLPVHPAGKFFHNTLWAKLKKEGYEPHIVNRLDRETSGLMVVALNKRSASSLGKQIQSKSIYKEYMAIVEGEFPGSVIARGHLVKDIDSELDKKVLYCEDDNFEQYGKNGVHTSFELLEIYSGLSMVKCVIKTGKMHQIRATLSSLKYPLVGDKIYGVDERVYLKFIRKELKDEDYRKMRMNRQALHAHILKFKDPDSGEMLEFKSELPEDMKRVLQKQ